MLPNIKQLNSVYQRRSFYLPRYFCNLTIMLNNFPITGAHVWHLSTGMERIQKWHFPIMTSVQYTNVFPTQCASLINFLLEISMAALFLTADVLLYTQEYNWKRYMYILQEALGHRCQNDLRCLANSLSFDLLQGKKISPAIKKWNLIVIPAL